MKTIYKLLYILFLTSTTVCCQKVEERLPVTAVSLDKTTLELGITKSQTLVATVSPEDAMNQEVKWSSNAPAIAEVDDQGKVTGISAGTAIITVTTVDGGKTSTCKVNVLNIIGVTITPPTVQMTLETSQALKAIVLRNDGGDETSLIWTSGDKAIVTVDDKGTLTAVAPGKTIVTAKTTDGKYSGTCEVMVIDLKIEYVSIPSGNFLMGSPISEPNRDDDETQHPVTLTENFSLSKYEITNQQYCSFLNANEISAAGKWNQASIDTTQCLIYNDALGINYDMAKKQWCPVSGKENFPVVSVTWFGAMEFAIWVGGSLPTEALWEYACRGGKTTTKPFGVGDGTKLDYTTANFYYKYSYSMEGGEYIDNTHTSLGSTQKVGIYQPNDFGLYDMHGNVWEWCSDWYESNYGNENPAKATTNPVGPVEGSKRVLKGGSWYYYSRCCRVAFRLSATPQTYSNHIGFRVARP